MLMVVMLMQRQNRHWETTEQQEGQQNNRKPGESFPLFLHEQDRLLGMQSRGATAACWRGMIPAPPLAAPVKQMEKGNAVTGLAKPPGAAPFQKQGSPGSSCPVSQSQSNGFPSRSSAPAERQQRNVVQLMIPADRSCWSLFIRFDPLNTHVRRGRGDRGEEDRTFGTESQ